MIELLAPGGSYEGLVAAVNAGADAVYMGGTRFGARAYAKNPQETELILAMDYCHLHGRKLYLTVNTLLKENELERELYAYILPLYEHGLDAVLVQDFGVFRFLHRNFPDLPLHASTQMTITSVDGARMLKEMGAERVVLSRELTLEEIRRICRAVEIETECFVHGALCYCYSGQCLMSSMIGGRSGNRGRCAQPCRLPYDLYQGEKRVNSEKERYLLSLKDICTLEILPELIDAGVCSYKIEGRMKRAEYAAGVTELYRKYIDLYRTSGRQNYRVDPEDERILMDLYNRGGFSGGYYHTYNGKTMMSMARPNHQGTPAARVLGVKNGQIRAKALEQLWAKDALENMDEAGNTGKELYVKEDVLAGREFLLFGNPELAKRQPTLTRVRSEHLLEQLRGQYLNREIQEKIKGKFILKKEKSAILKVTYRDISVMVSGEQPEKADRQPLEEATVRRQLSKTGGTPFLFETLEIELEDGLFYPMQSLNELRRAALQRLKAQIEDAFKRTAQSIGGTMPDREADRLAAEDPGATALPVRQELRVSVETWEQFYAVLKQTRVSAVYLDCGLFLEPGRCGDTDGVNTFGQTMELLHARQKKGYLMMPVIWRENSIRSFEQVFSGSDLECFDGFLLRDSEQLLYLHRFAGRKELVADSNLYTLNREARRFFRDRGIRKDTLPVECNRRELEERGCEGSECIVYGYLPLMVTAQCLVKNTSGCRKIPGVRWLRDRKGAEFPVRNQCSVCANVIYNSVPLELISEGSKIRMLHPASFRLSFTFESAGWVEQITCAAAEVLLEGKEVPDLGVRGTRGHFKRGVE